MFATTLLLHSLLRWIVVALGLLAAVRGCAGWMGARAWTPADDRAGRFFTLALDLQVLLGLLLHLFLSSITTAAFQNMGVAMQNQAARYWTVEHPLLMMAALVLAHLGRARARRADDPARRHRLAGIFFTVAVILILVGIPWPFSSVARPWLPLA